MKLLTMKFGGTSVGTADAIRGVTGIVNTELAAGNRVIVVVSAMAGVTDTLLDAARKAAAGNKSGYLSTGEKLRDRHIEVLNQLVDDAVDRDQVVAQVNTLLDEFVQVCNAINILGELTPRILDTIVSFGERLSSRVIAAVMRSNGINAPTIRCQQVCHDR